MSKVVRRYTMPPASRSFIGLKINARIIGVTAEERTGHTILWAIEDEHAEDDPNCRAFVVIQRDQPMTFDPQWYIGTVQYQKGDLVFHIFEVPQ